MPRRDAPNDVGRVGGPLARVVGLVRPVGAVRDPRVGATRARHVERLGRSTSYPRLSPRGEVPGAPSSQRRRGAGSVVSWVADHFCAPSQAATWTARRAANDVIEAMLSVHLKAISLVRSGNRPASRRRADLRKSGAAQGARQVVASARRELATLPVHRPPHGAFVRNDQAAVGSGPALVARREGRTRSERPSVGRGAGGMLMAVSGMADVRGGEGEGYTHTTS